MSYEFKGTEGPWSVGFGGGLGGDVISWTCFLDEQGCIQLPVRSGGEAICVIPHEDNPERHLRDAQLIAAAPELFEALSEMLADYSDACEEWDNENRKYGEALIAQARQALAKATGGEG